MIDATRLAATGAVLAVAGILAVAVRPIGTPRGGPADAPASGDPGLAAYVHGTMTTTGCCGPEVETKDADGNRLTLRGSVVTGTVDMDDPRLDGDYTLTVSIDEFPQFDTAERVEVAWGELLIENADGAWRGGWSGTWDPDVATPSQLVVYPVTGEGAYEGLSALLSPTAFSYPSATVAGAIFTGPLPPR